MWSKFYGIYTIIQENIHMFTRHNFEQNLNDQKLIAITQKLIKLKIRVIVYLKGLLTQNIIQFQFIR